MQKQVKKAIALLLAVAMLWVVPVFGAQAEDAYTSWLNPQSGPYLISDPHKLGQEFVPDFTELKTVRAYLDMTEGDNTVTLSIHPQFENQDGKYVETAALYTQSYTFSAPQKDWFVFELDTPVTLTEGKRYVLVLTSTKRAVWHGVLGNTSTERCCVLNYDEAAYGGWNREVNCVAFEVLPAPASWQVVLETISALPDEIALTDAAKVSAARRDYDALSDEDKALVTNYGRLTAAEAVIADLQSKIYTSHAGYGTALFQCRQPAGGGQEFRPDFANLTKVTSYLEIQEESDVTLTIWKGYPDEGAVELYSQTYHMAQQAAGWIEFPLSNPLFLEEENGKYVFMLSSTGGMLMFGAGGAPHPSECWAINGEPPASRQPGWHTGFQVEGTEAEEYQKLIRKINALPAEITLSDETRVAGLLSEYAALPAEDQAKVANYAVLSAAQQTIDALKLQQTIDALIDDIGALKAVDTLTMNDAAAVAALRERYNALSSADQAKVTNVSTLTAAEAKIEELKAADRGYQALMRKIEDMPSPVTLANKQLVDELAAQYDALSSEDQQKVENSSKLSKAREDLSFYLENFAFPEDSPFTYQTINTDGLYLLTSPNNMAGQQFIPDFDELIAVAAYLEIEANNTITVTIAQHTADKHDGSDQIVYYTEDFEVEQAVTGWVEFRLSQPVAVSQGEIYEMTLTSSARAVWMGKLNLLSNGTDGCRALVYDLPAYGGWDMALHSTAFQAVGTAMEAYRLLINKIATLPDEITLQQEATIAKLRSEYDSLSSEDQKKVTNYEVLVAAENRIQELKESEQGEKINQVIEAITAMDEEVTFDSAEVICSVVEQTEALVKDYGEDVLELVTNCDRLLQTCSDYNALVRSVTMGDINDDGKIDAADALKALQHSVELTKLTGKAGRAAMVNTDDKIDAADALLILQYSVELIDTFPAKLEEINVQFLFQTSKNKALFDNTRQSMFERTAESGYASTSVTGAYSGMYVRDTSIQILAHVACGDYDQARKILNYTFAYHETYPSNYAIHVMDNDAAPISTLMQVDTTFFLLHAWYQFAANAPDTAENREFIERYIDKVKIFAEFYFLTGYFNEELGLLRNPSLEHSREGSYFNGYDLLTNVYASQALHELSLYFQDSDPESAAAWATYADTISSGIHKNLVAEVDGKTIYAEMQAIDKIYSVTGEKTVDDTFYVGFSWVNLAPMGAHWYAMDDEIMNNTYEKYQEYGSAVYYKKYPMLEACVTYQKPEAYHERAVIGKGLAWELMYCYGTGRYERVQELIQFLEEYSNDMYRETWQFTGGGSDTANQEHANWMILANEYVCRFIES